MKCYGYFKLDFHSADVILGHPAHDVFCQRIGKLWLNYIDLYVFFYAIISLAFLSDPNTVKTWCF